MSEDAIQAILIVAGVLTLGAGIGLLAPRRLLATLFGVGNPDDSVVLLARHWSLLIAIVGALLLYAAYHQEARTPILFAAAVEKLAIGLLVLMSPLRKRPITLAVVGADAIMALLCVLILVQGHVA